MRGARLLLLVTLPALAGWGVGSDVVEVRGDDGGSGPAFAALQQRTVVGGAGQSVTLACRVLRLGDKAVSWVRARDLQILSHAGAVFTADTRVSAWERAGAGAGSTHAVRIERLRAGDIGRYECQVNTEPKMSLFFNLSIVEENIAVPATVVSAVGAHEVSVVVGGAATLACEARALAPPPPDIVWLRSGRPIALQGGVALQTERWAAPARTVSRLTLARAAPSDAGDYECAAAAGEKVALRLDVAERAGSGGDVEEEAMQRDQAQSAAPRALSAGAGAVLALLALALALRRAAA